MEELGERRIGRATVLFGPERGKYPDGNSLYVEGRERSLIIDPSLGLLPRSAHLPHVDLVVSSHCHEDHIAGNHLFPEATWHLHELDLPGIRSLDAMMEIYGYSPETTQRWRRRIRDDFHFRARENAVSFSDGDVFELGGTRVRAIHAPGHTRGHCVFLVEPEGILFLGDIDLSSFGPFYGDAWSDLEDFERTLELVRGIDVPHYATFHHIGVLDGREAFLERLGPLARMIGGSVACSRSSESPTLGVRDGRQHAPSSGAASATTSRMASMIDTRERRLLAFLGEPHTLDEIATTRFVYRPGDQCSEWLRCRDEKYGAPHRTLAATGPPARGGAGAVPRSPSLTGRGPWLDATVGPWAFQRTASVRQRQCRCWSCRASSAPARRRSCVTCSRMPGGAASAWP